MPKTTPIKDSAILTAPFDYLADLYALRAGAKGPRSFTFNNRHRSSA